MKRILSACILGLLALTGAAQNKKLVIHYVAHDHHTDALIRRLDSVFESAAADKGSSTYLYLANADQPSVYRCNAENSKGYEAFKDVLRSQTSHNIWPEVDIDRILDLLDKDDYLRADGSPRYDEFELNFYLIPSFWTANYNETLIGRLF